jgi:hypothetical protein
VNVIGKSPRIKTLGNDPPIGASPKSRPSTPSMKSPGKSPFSNYQNVTGAGISYKYESPSQPTSEAERYYNKVRFVLERKKSLNGIHITHRDDRVRIERFSQIDGQTINLNLPANWKLMRDLYMLVALCDDEIILSNLLEANFIDFSEEPSPDLFKLSSKWR